MAAPRRGMFRVEFKIASAASYFEVSDLAYLRSKMTDRSMVSIGQQSFLQQDRSIVTHKTMFQQVASCTYIDVLVLGENLIEIL